MTRAQAATGRAFAPVVSAVEGAQRFGTSVVAKVPVVNTVADRFATASTRLSSASAQVSAAASTVEGLAEDTVTNVMDYGMNTPVSEQKPSRYMQAASAPAISSLVVPTLVSKNTEGALRHFKVGEELVSSGGQYMGDYASGFTNYVLTEDELNINKANQEGWKNVTSSLAENMSTQGKK